MRSIVCIKRVPDSEARLRVAADGLAIESSGVKFSMNPYDEFALEEALRLKEQFGEGSVTAITVGPDIYVIDQFRCTECVGAEDEPQCILVCPADCIEKDPEWPETEEELQEKYDQLHG